MVMYRLSDYHSFYFFLCGFFRHEVQGALLEILGHIFMIMFFVITSSTSHKLFKQIITKIVCVVNSICIIIALQNELI